MNKPPTSKPQQKTTEKTTAANSLTIRTGVKAGEDRMFYVPSASEWWNNTKASVSNLFS